MGLFNILGDWMGALPGGSKLSRRAWVVIKYTPKGESEDKDISEDISKYFLGLSYTDNLSESADDITLTLEDRAQLWAEEWFPESGSMLDITIHRYNWKNLGEGEIELPLGKFEIDEIEVQGFPSTVQIKAVSVLGNSTLRGVRKNRTWENISVWKCADDICKENNLELFWDCEENPNLDHVEQADESDLAFLQKICKDNGRSLKVTTEKVIIFDDDKYEKNDPVIFCLKPGAQVENEKGLANLDLLTGYTLKAKNRDIYWKCHVKYQKGKDKKVIEGEFAAPDKTEGRILYVGDQVADQAEAERLAKKKLREANKDEFTGNLASLGDFNLVAGLVIQMAGFGKFDGNYIILKASHEIGSSYTTSIEIRKCLNGY
jgi:phage protein D